MNLLFNQTEETIMGCLANISYLYVQWLSGVFELFECLPCRCLKKTASSAADVVDSET